jgi:chromosomal replication initiator protein
VSQLNFDLGGTTATEAWAATLELARERTGVPTYESWLRDLRPRAVEEDSLVVDAPSEFKRSWVEKKYTLLLEECAEAAFGVPVHLRFSVCDASPSDTGRTECSREVYTSRPAAKARVRDMAEAVPDEVLFGAVPLNDRYTFDNFVVGPSNRLAQAGAIAAARKPGGSFNPLFLYGGAGLGKTHLMHAIGHAAKADNPNCRVAYMSGESFTTQYVGAIRERKMDDFRRRFRYADVWLVDDIQFIADKERTEEEFFHTFNTLRDTGKQIVLSSDRAPKDLKLDTRLRSRFEAGLVADIGSPDLETRIAILQNKAHAEGSPIPDDVLLYMAELIQSNIRVLEGALIKLVAYASVTQSPITQQLAGDVLGSYFQGRCAEGGLCNNDIKKAVAEAFGVTVAEINGTSRSKGIVLARQVSMHLIRELTGASLPEIGRDFGGKDHSTVVHSCQKIRLLLKSDLDLSKRLADLTEQLRKIS